MTCPAYEWASVGAEALMIVCVVLIMLPVIVAAWRHE